METESSRVMPDVEYMGDVGSPHSTFSQVIVCFCRCIDVSRGTVLLHESAYTRLRAVPVPGFRDFR